VTGARLRDGLLLALGTLTVLRVPPPGRVDRGTAAVAMTLAPLVGALVAAPAAIVAVIARAAGAGPLVAAGLAVAALTLASGGLHLDGLADTVDGVAGGRGDRRRSLEIMRQGQVGPLGATALVLVLVVQVAALAQCLTGAGSTGRFGWGALALPIAAAGGRAVLQLLCARGVPAARPGGLGAAVAGSVPRPLALAVLIVVAALAWLATAWAPVAVSPLRAALAVVAGAVVGALLAGRAARRLGGITGDVLGAGVEYGVTAALVLLSAGWAG
jgi:adenosylcobinamide-GDP ribazoletransferase